MIDSGSLMDAKAGVTITLGLLDVLTHHRITQWGQDFVEGVIGREVGIHYLLCGCIVHGCLDRFEHSSTELEPLAAVLVALLREDLCDTIGSSVVEGLIWLLGRRHSGSLT